MNEDIWQFFRVELNSGRQIFAASRGGRDEALERIRRDDPLWLSDKVHYIGAGKENYPGLVFVADLGKTPWEFSK